MSIRRGAARVIALCGATIVVITPTVAQRPSPVAAETAAFLPRSGVHHLVSLVDRVADLPGLSNLVTLDFHAVPLERVLTTIADRGHLSLTYSRNLMGLDRRVSLSVSGVRVLDALEAAIAGRGLDVLAAPSGELVVTNTALAPAGKIQGTVTDAVTNAPLTGARVTLDGSSLRAASRAPDGSFLVLDVPYGTYTLHVRMVGYAEATRVVQVVDSQFVTVLIALRPAPVLLDQVVTTATGDQRRYQIGTVLATINADSIVPEAATSDLTDLINGRAPGVEVLSSSGMVGTGPRIRIRGLNSVSLSNDPILIIDGVRADAAPGQANAYGVGPGSGSVPGQFTVGVGPFTTNGAGGGFPVPSRLNDIDPDQIASIEIVKGPSAATLYGTDAANGVIVVTTKHGRVGPPRWTVTAEDGLSDVPARFPNNYYAWGHTTGAQRTSVQCTLYDIGSVGSPNLADRTCAIDSVTHWEPLNHASTSVFGVGHRDRYGLQVSGGAPSVSYFLSGTTTGETGPLRLPVPEQHRFEAFAGVNSLPADQLRPNATQSTQLAARFGATLGSRADVGVSANFVTRDQRAPNESYASFILGAISGPGYRDSLSGYAENLNGFGHYSLPANSFAYLGTEALNRFSASLNANWRPAGWLTARAVTGIDLVSTDEATLLRPQDDEELLLTGFGPPGDRSDVRSDVTVYTADAGGTATVPFAGVFTSRTSAGVQYARRETSASGAGATGLALGGTTVEGAAFQFGDEDRALVATLGTYFEETVSARDRLFLTGAIRIDEGSGFGGGYQAAVYPKASASWLVLPHSQALRLRAAYGESGIQPDPSAKLLLYLPLAGSVAGTPSTGTALGQIGNPGVRPERTAEWESGIDAQTADGRVTFEGTVFDKLSHNALITAPLPSSLGGGFRQENVGAVDNRGAEVALTVQPLAIWTLTLSGSVTRNRLVSLGPANLTPFGTERLIVGYPLYGLWGQTLHFVDANHDGRLEPSELTLSDSVRFAGPSIPPYQATASTSLSLFHQHLHINALVSYQGGHLIDNGVANVQCLVFAPADGGRGCNDPHAALADQARQIATYAPNRLGANSGFFEPGWFVKFRELSITYLIPGNIVRVLHARTASITVGGRNLGTITRYGGADPEANTSYVTGESANTDYGTMPQSRYGFFRLNLGL